MRAGKLRNRVHIQEQEGTRTASGAVNPDAGWHTVASRWAEITAESGSESVQSQQVQAESTLNMRFRYFDGLRVQHRIKLGSRTFSINSVLDVEGRKREHLCTVTEVPVEAAV